MCACTWLNTNVFLVWLSVLVVQDEVFFSIACMCIEPELPTITLEPILPQDTVNEAQELQIEVAVLWLRIAGAKMYMCRDIVDPKGNPSWKEKHGCPGGSRGM